MSLGGRLFHPLLLQRLNRSFESIIGSPVCFTHINELWIFYMIKKCGRKVYGPVPRDRVKIESVLAYVYSVISWKSLKKNLQTLKICAKYIRGIDCSSLTWQRNRQKQIANSRYQRIAISELLREMCLREGIKLVCWKWKNWWCLSSLKAHKV